MGLYDKFKTSADLEKDGVSFVIGNTRIHAARAGGSNKAFVNALRDYTEKNGRALELNAVDNNEQTSVLRSLYAKHIVKDWETNLNEEAGTDDKGAWIAPNWVKGIENPEGGDLLPVTHDNIMDTFNNLPELFGWLKTSCENMRHFRAAQVGKTVKN